MRATSWPFAVGLMIGAAVVVFGRETPVGRRLLVHLHLGLARLRRWLRRERR